MPFFDGEWRPTSFYAKIAYNAAGGMHTLCLLDIKVREPDFEAMMQGKVKHQPPRFMTVRRCAAAAAAAAATHSLTRPQVNRAVEQLLEAEEKEKGGVCAPGRLAVGCARLGQPDQRIVAGTLQQLLTVDFGEPLHCLALCAPELHPIEREFIEQFMVDGGAVPAAEAGAEAGAPPPPPPPVEA